MGLRVNFEIDVKCVCVYYFSGQKREWKKKKLKQVSWKHTFDEFMPLCFNEHEHDMNPSAHI